MRVLGISPLDKDATVSFVEDGRVLFACGEERLSRTKLQDGFPSLALELGLARTGWTLDSIDRVAYAFLAGPEEGRLVRQAADRDRQYQCRAGLVESARAYGQALSRVAGDTNGRSPIPGLSEKGAEFVPPKPLWKRAAYEAATQRPALDLRAHQKYYRQWVRDAIEDHQKWHDVLEAELAKRNLAGKLVRFRHHDTHAANAFYASGLDRAVVLVLDGYGSGCCGGVYLAGPEGIEPLHRYAFPYSLGIFYEQVTSALGFRPSRHEGKIVGLAAYGDPDILTPMLLARFDLADGDIKIRAPQNCLITRAMACHFAKRDIAAAYQRVLEFVACESLAYWMEKTDARSVVMSGGVHANVKLNQRLREVTGVGRVFVYPNMGDGGCATGAAMLASDMAGRPRKAFVNVYFGPEYSDDEIAAALDAEGLRYQRVDGIEQRIAEVLAENGIVARFNGRMEYGPRALGNRSILYPACDPEVNRWLNDQLGRTEFMPFAPAVLAERAGELFHNLEGCEQTAEFMTITFDCTDQMKRHSPAAVHVDGTARPQLVTPESNPSFHKVLAAYDRLTGIPVLINTSFNMHEEPLVGTPADAVRAFLLGNIEYLAVGHFLVPHPQLKERRDTTRRPVTAGNAVP